MPKYQNCLLIDDDNVSNVITENTLLKMLVCNNIQRCLTVEKSIEYLNKQQKLNTFPDLILLDLDFPIDEQNGWDFLEKAPQLFKEDFLRTHLFVLTSTISKKDLDKIRTYPFIKGFISKPFDKDKVSILLEDK